jgi:hypothetical protein
MDTLLKDDVVERVVKAMYPPDGGYVFRFGRRLFKTRV